MRKRVSTVISGVVSLYVDCLLWLFCQAGSSSRRVVCSNSKSVKMRVKDRLNVHQNTPIINNYESSSFDVDYLQKESRIYNAPIRSYMTINLITCGSCNWI